MTVHEGDLVTLEGFGVCSVESTADQSLVTVRVPGGQCVRLGRKAIDELRTNSGPQDGREARQ